MTARKQNENLGGAKLELNKKSRRILTKRKRNVCTCMEHNKHKNRHKPKNPKRIRDLVENSPFGHSRAPPKRFKTPQKLSELLSTRENSLFGHSRAPTKRLKTSQNSSELLSARENSPFGHSRAPPKRLKTPQNSSELLSNHDFAALSSLTTTGSFHLRSQKSSPIL